MTNCENCKLRFFCELDPDLNLEDANKCFEQKNAEVLEVPNSFIEQSFKEFCYIHSFYLQQKVIK